MNFSNKFKIVWWVILLVVTTVFGGFRIHIGDLKNFDVFLFIFWVILVLFPIISEVSIFGINVKKDIEDAKNELKSSIAEIKNEINFKPTINFNPPTPATDQEYKKKVENEAREDIKESEKKENRKFVAVEQVGTEKRTSHNQKAQERLDKVLSIEKLVLDNLISIHGLDFRPQMKLSDESSERKIVVDGLIIKNDRIAEVVEIKFTSSRSFEAFYFIAARYRNRLHKLFGWKIPIRFIVVSETMDQPQAALIKSQLDKLNFDRSLISGLPIIKADFFKYTGSELIKIIPLTDSPQS